MLPAFNEAPFLAATIGELVDGLRARGAEFELLIVENGSTDATLEVARSLEAANPEVRALTLPKADYGGALRHGFLHATGDIVANFDVDYFDLGFLDAAVDVLRRDGAAIVVAAKRGEGASDTRALPRRLVTTVFAAVLRRAFHLSVVDTHGMKVLDRAAVSPFVAASGSRTDLYDTELVLRTERAGLSVLAIPVVVEERRASRTSIVRRIPRSVNGLGRLWLQLRRENR